MKLLGINLEDDGEEHNIVPMVDSLVYLDGRPYPFSLKPETPENIVANYRIRNNIKLRDSLIRINDISKKIFQKAKNGQYSLTKLKFNKSVVVTSNHAIHCIPTSINSEKISIQDLLEKLQSISKNGLLATEKFGINTILAHLSEVPFRVSFHKIAEEQSVSKLQFLVNYESDERDFSHNVIKFFIDFNNPILNQLKRLDPMHVLERDSLDREVYKSLLSFGRVCYYAIDNEAVIRSMEESFKYRYIEKKSITPIYMKMSEEEYVQENIAKILQNRPEFLQRVQKNYGFILDGVPSELIVGIQLPERLKQNLDFTLKTSELFPNAVIFDNSGVILANKNNIKRDEERILS